MKFKTDQIKRDYQDMSIKPSANNIILRQFVQLLESVSKLTGHGELTITDYLRNDPKSLHHYGRALDIRVRDKDKTWYWGMRMLGKALWIMSKRLRLNPHIKLYGQPQQHIHIEIRDLPRD